MVSQHLGACFCLLVAVSLHGCSKIENPFQEKPDVCKVITENVCAIYSRMKDPNSEERKNKMAEIPAEAAAEVPAEVWDQTFEYVYGKICPFQMNGFKINASAADKGSGKWAGAGNPQASDSPVYQDCQIWIKDHPEVTDYKDQDLQGGVAMLKAVGDSFMKDLDEWTKKYEKEKGGGTPEGTPGTAATPVTPVTADAVPETSVDATDSLMELDAGGDEDEVDPSADEWTDPVDLHASRRGSYSTDWVDRGYRPEPRASRRDEVDSGYRPEPRAYRPDEIQDEWENEPAAMSATHQGETAVEPAGLSRERAGQAAPSLARDVRRMT